MKLSISPPPFAGAPVVVLIAGLGGSGSYWLPQLAVLGQEYQVVCYDQRGTGNNPDTLPEDYTLAHMADELALALAGAGIARYCVVGHALGNNGCASTHACAPPACSRRSRTSKQRRAWGVRGRHPPAASLFNISPPPRKGEKSDVPSFVNGWLTLNAHTRRCFDVRERLLHAGGCTGQRTRAAWRLKSACFRACSLRSRLALP